MAKQILKCQQLRSTTIFLLVLFITLQNADSSCILDIQLFSSSVNSSNCSPGNGCCDPVFDEYLYALAEMAHKTGRIYLDSEEQEDCLLSIKQVYSDVSGCGIDRLTGGLGGCSSYTKAEVVNKLGNMFNALSEDCKLVDLENDGNDQACRFCFNRWKKIGGLLNNGSDLNSDETCMCKFAILIALTSNLIDDRKRVLAIYDCLELYNNLFVGNEKAEGTAGSGQNRQMTGRITLIAGLAGLVAIIIIIAVSASIYFRFRNRQNPSTGREVTGGTYESYAEELEDLRISPREIYQATDNLNELNLIGQGIAGKVYRGKMSDGQDVAIKHIINDGFAETFVREVTSLSHIRHPNLVALLGFCKHRDYCFLVYELCHNGNLSEWLYGKDKVLSWIRRLEVAIDCARGLWFLHTYPEGCIVHRDIKPTNILINAQFQAKLSDFGLSKVMDVGQSYVSSEVRGTFGYVDPEYRTNRHVNAKGDVYSFGIVLLQVISGQRVINMNLHRPMQLNKMAKFLARSGNVAEFADPKLGGEYSVEAFELVLKVALSCTGVKLERPSMEDVVPRLEKALEISMRMMSTTYG